MSNESSLVDFLYSDMERFLPSPCLCFLGENISQGVFQKFNKAEEVTNGSLPPRKHSGRTEF